jgi:hypothetical protein
MSARMSISTNETPELQQEETLQKAALTHQSEGEAEAAPAEQAAEAPQAELSADSGETLAAEASSLPAESVAEPVEALASEAVSLPDEAPEGEASPAEIAAEAPADEAGDSPEAAEIGVYHASTGEEAEVQEGLAPEPQAEPAPAEVRDLPPLNEALLVRIEEIMALDNEEASKLFLEEATLADLIHLMDRYIAEPEVRPAIPRVSLVRRTLDHLREQAGGQLPDEIEQVLRNLFATFGKRRSEYQRKAEGEREENTRRKREMLEKLQQIVDANDPERIREVRELQEEWKAVGQVGKADMEAIYSQYRALLDRFYKLRDMHREMQDYDRRINLQEKERIIQEILKLIPPEEDRENADLWRERTDVLHELQEQWKSFGQVPRDDKDRINEEYRAAVDQFFEARQGFTAQQDQLRHENANKKLAIIARLEGFAAFEGTKPREWNEASEEVRRLQQEWAPIGPAPSAINGELWHKYRELCNTFFAKKSKFFNELEAEREANLVKKRELCERAEQMTENISDWEATFQAYVKMQEEWRQIGPVPDRHSNKLWNRFRAACDKFFELRRQNGKSQNSEEAANLEAKKALIAEVRRIIDDSDMSVDQAIGQVKELQARWKTIGRVPIKEKDKIWEEFRSEVDHFFDSIPDRRRSGGRQAARAETARAKTTSIESISEPDKRVEAIKKQQAALRRRIEMAQETVDNYTANLGMISKSKSSEALRNQIQRQIDDEQKEIAELKKQIKELTEMVKNLPKEEPAPEPSAEAPEQEASAAEAQGEAEPEAPEAAPEV